jgi:hypothetical protein
MMAVEETLLSHIASNFIKEYENVANSSISYLLNKYPSAREALSAILGIPVPDYYFTEVATQSNGRPDVVGKDKDNNIIVIIEGKFWASLTDNQPNNYLKELSEKGRLLFLVPEFRKESLKNQIKNRLGYWDERIETFSWKYFLSSIRGINEKNYSSELDSDLTQLDNLCKKMDKEGLAPLSNSDLDPIHGRLIYNFVNLIEECKLLLKEWNMASFEKLKTTPNKDSFGFYFMGYNYPCYLCVSWKNWFEKPNHQPIWMRIYYEYIKYFKKF